MGMRRNAYPYPFNLLMELNNIDYPKFSNVDLIRLTRGYGYLFRELFTYVLNTFLTSGTIKMIELYYEELNSIDCIAQKYNKSNKEVESMIVDTMRAIAINPSFLRLIECSTIAGFIAKEIAENPLTAPHSAKKIEYERGKRDGFNEGYKKGRNDLIEEINESSIEFMSKEQMNEDKNKIRFTEEQREILRTPIEQLGLSSRAANCILRGHPCTNLYELACIEPEDLINTRNMGQISFQEIVNMLKSKGIDTTKYEKYIVTPKMK